MHIPQLRSAVLLAARILAATVAAALLLEAGLRVCPLLVPDQWLQLQCLRWRLWGDGLLSPDPEMGVAIRAPLERHEVWDGAPVRLRHIPFLGESRIGYRAGAEGRDPTKVDIAALGDSHAYGLEVDEDATWESRLSRLTGLSVANLALPYQGTAQEMILYRRYGVRFHPRLVLMTICPNDFWDNKNFHGWLAQRQGGEQSFPRYRFRMALRWPGPLIRLARLANKSIVLQQLLFRPRVDTSTPPMARVEGASQSPEAMAGLVADVVQIRALAAAGGARFGAILTDIWWGPPWAAPAAQLKRALRSRGIPVLDLSEKMCGPSGCWPDELRLPRDRHWSQRGQARVAEEVRRFLLEARLLPLRLRDPHR